MIRPTSWDALYTTELSNHTANPSDVGTIWFSDAGAEDRVLSFLEDLDDEGILDKESSSFIDIGTGNGHFLWEMRRREWQGVLLGVDYSEGSVRLAKQASARSAEEDGDEEDEETGKEEELVPPQFELWNVMTQDVDAAWFPSSSSSGDTAGFDVLLDKGTFDAISLSSTLDAHGRRECEGYREKVEKLVKKGTGRVVVTSCNWTSEELKGWFEVAGGELVYERAVKYPSFRFGGKEGQRVCTLCFRRRGSEEDS